MVVVGEHDEALLVSNEPGRFAVGEAFGYLRQGQTKRPQAVQRGLAFLSHHRAQTGCGSTATSTPQRQGR